MTFPAPLRALAQSPLFEELQTKRQRRGSLHLCGLARPAKALLASAMAQAENRPLLAIAATLEEAGRWAALLETMNWEAVRLYPTSEALPDEVLPPDPEMAWGQMQTLLELSPTTAIVTTIRAVQPHLPPPATFREACLSLRVGLEMSLTALGETLTRLGYERTSPVESEGQWTRRGDIVDIFPVSSEVPVRLDWLGDRLESLREFDPASQRTLDRLEEVTVVPATWSVVWGEAPTEEGPVVSPQATASLLDYLPTPTLVALDEPERLQAWSDRWVEAAERLWQEHPDVPKRHRPIAGLWDSWETLALTELESDEGTALPCRAIPAVPHQFGNLAKTLRDYRQQQHRIFVISAQPSRAASLLQEHDFPCQFVPNPRDLPAIEKIQNQRTAVALKYANPLELQGFAWLPFRLTFVSDREFFGQHGAGAPTYVRKRRRSVSKQVDPNKLTPGDLVVHKKHGIGKFLRLESLTVDHATREYLVLQYEDGLLRVAADQANNLSRYRGTGEGRPPLHRLGSRAWSQATAKARKSARKVAFDLLALYAKRTQQIGFGYPPDTPWQQEMEDSFPYTPTPDQQKATQDVKRDMESPHPMDRLVCGDVGFGKTEVAVRAIFKAVVSGHKQAALLAPTTILAQQHYHTLQERFAPYPITVALLNRFKTPAERKEILQKLTTGEIDVVVGTHHLLSKEVKFRDLGLLVIDEEQRFGVAQKEKIKAYKTEVDVLTLTATPIPRTLYMALSGAREMSLIQTPPPSRRAIQTHLSRYSEDKVKSAIRYELDRSGQIFYVVPRVEGIEEISTRLRELVPGLRIAIAHGQMSDAELEATMLAFNDGEADLLLATTIIESGLDIPRANTIIIDDAQKFGLSQLYQLRGRVGRAGVQAKAWLFYPEVGELSEPARKRLQAIQEFAHLGSGYQLAMRDLEIRGAGNLLGAEQSGQMDTVGFDLYMEMLQEAIAEIRGSEIPTVDDTQIDLAVTAFIPASYIPDPDEKMSAYRTVAAALSHRELNALVEEWRDRYGPIPTSALQLLEVMKLKLVAKRLGFSRIRPEQKQHIVLETKMEEPAWKRLQEALPNHLKPRFVYQGGKNPKVTVRGLGAVSPNQQLTSLREWLELLTTAIPQPLLT